jgi:hypothetical protein
MATTLTEIMMHQKQAHIQIQANYCLASKGKQIQMVREIEDFYRAVYYYEKK